MQFSPYIIDLFVDSQAKQQHIFFDQQKKTYSLGTKGAATTQKIKELNLHDIVDLAMKCDATKMSPKKIAAVATAFEQMADKTEKEHFSGVGVISKLFDCIYNLVSGRGFQTTASAIRDIAAKLKGHIPAAPPHVQAAKSYEAQQDVTPAHKDDAPLQQQKKLKLSSAPSPKQKAADQKLAHLMGKIQGKQAMPLFNPMIKVQPTQEEQEPHPAGAIIYKKGAKKLAPANKTVLGKGALGKVHVHKEHALRVIKKTSQRSSGIEKEYELGQKFDHPNLVKVHELYIKEYEDGTKKYKLVMDKIQGPTLDHLDEKLSDETVKHLLAQARDCCRYLFNQKVVWQDVNSGNIFVTKEKEDLMLADFGQWHTVEDPKERGIRLLLGSMEMVGWIAKSSSLRAAGKKDPVIEKKIQFPQQLFGEQFDFHQIVTGFGGANALMERPEFQRIAEKMSTMSDAEIEDYLASYFDQVIKAFDQATRSQS